MRWAVLVELCVMEQRFQTVLAVVQDGWKVTEVAARLGVRVKACAPPVGTVHICVSVNKGVDPP